MRHFQALRNSEICSDKTDALYTLKNLLPGSKDGELVICRYQDGTQVKVLLGFNNTIGTGTRYFVFDMDAILSYINNLSISSNVITYTNGYGKSGTITLPTATASTLGVVKTGTNITNSSGTISVPTATASTLGVVKTGTTLSITNGTIDVLGLNAGEY